MHNGRRSKSKSFAHKKLLKTSFCLDSYQRKSNSQNVFLQINPLVNTKSTWRSRSTFVVDSKVFPGHEKVNMSPDCGTWMSPSPQCARLPEPERSATLWKHGCERACSDRTEVRYVLHCCWGSAKRLVGQRSVPIVWRRRGNNIFVGTVCGGPAPFAN